MSSIAKTFNLAAKQKLMGLAVPFKEKGVNEFFPTMGLGDVQTPMLHKKDEENLTNC